MADEHVEFEEKADAKTSGSERVRMWLAALEAAGKEEKEWREEASKATDIYRAEDSEQKNTKFNILHSNVETILPAIYNSTQALQRSGHGVQASRGCPGTGAVLLA